jgi:hypothetical protein
MRFTQRKIFSKLVYCCFLNFIRSQATKTVDGTNQTASDLVSVNITRDSNSTAFRFESLQPPRQLVNVTKYAISIFDKTLSYSEDKSGAYFTLPVKAASVQFQFINQNCIFPIVCISRNATIYPSDLPRGVNIACELTAFDGQIIRQQTTFLEEYSDLD